MIRAEFDVKSLDVIMLMNLVKATVGVDSGLMTSSIVTRLLSESELTRVVKKKTFTIL